MDHFIKKCQNLSKNERVLGTGETQNEQGKEQGRSMVEMLGVLAVVGVLSVGAISGYRYAMNKYRANQTVNELNLLSHQVAIAMMSKNGLSGTLTLGEPYDSGKLATSGYEFTAGCGENAEKTVSCDGQTQYSMKISGLSQSICEEAQSQGRYLQYINEVAGNCASGNANSLVFKFDAEKTGHLSETGETSQADEWTPVSSSWEGEDSLESVISSISSSDLPQTVPSLTCEHGSLLYGVCSCDSNYFGTTCSQYCSGSQVWDGTNCVAECPSGTHYESSIKECVSGCTENANCESDEYCYLREGYSCSDEFGSGSGQKYGSCRKVQGDSMKVGDYIVSTRGMTWWSAERFCERAGNKHRVSGSAFGCNLSAWSCSSTVYTQFENAGINDGGWLNDLEGDGSCNAYFVDFYCRNGLNYHSRGKTSRAICR